MILGIILVIAIFFGLYYVSCQRSFVDLKEKIKNSLSNIAVQQKSRRDALTQLANATKSYKNYEGESLINIVNARSGKVPKNASEVEDSENAFQDALSKISVVVEAYPELKASGLYTKTMDSINDYEAKVRISRQVYNDCVTKYNRKVKQVPSSIIAGMMGLSEEAYLNFEEKTQEMPNLEF